MAAKKLTPEVYAQRKQHILESLALNPELTRDHFRRNFSYRHEWLKQLEAEGLVFGEPVRKHLRFGK